MGFASSICLPGHAANNPAVCPGLLPGSQCRALLPSLQDGDPRLPQEEASFQPKEAQRPVFLGSLLQKLSRCRGDGGSPLLAAFTASLHPRLLHRHGQQVKQCKKYALLLPLSAAAESLNICSDYKALLIRAFYYFAPPFRPS